jgi:hypothetical protein
MPLLSAKSIKLMVNVITSLYGGYSWFFVAGCIVTTTSWSPPCLFVTACGVTSRDVGVPPHHNVVPALIRWLIISRDDLHRT